ncbi:MAG: DUF559 domain-containing protein [Spirochaetota bacterium]
MTRESTVRARRLRADQTSTEVILWEHLWNRRLGGLKFTRQHTIRYIEDGKPYYFIADFYCARRKLCVEIDGSIHNDQKTYDCIRSSLMAQFGIRTIRFSNDEVLENVDAVLKMINRNTSAPLPLSHFPVREGKGQGGMG